MVIASNKLIDVETPKLDNSFPSALKKYKL